MTAARQPGETAEEVQLRADLELLSLARRFTADAARRWGFHAVDDLGIVVSELVSNAIVHGEGDPLIRIRRDGGDHVRVEVRDDSPVRPRVREPEPFAMSGRGMRIVDALSDDWGVTDLAGGSKVVWCRLALPVAVS